jgi:hypothetical protein
VSVPSSSNFTSGRPAKIGSRPGFPSRFAQDLRENDEPQPVQSAVVRLPRWGVYVACVMSGVAYPYCGRPVVL